MRSFLRKSSILLITLLAFALPLSLDISFAEHTSHVALEVNQTHASYLGDALAEGMASFTYFLAQAVASALQYIGEFLDNIINFTLTYNFDNIVGIDAGWRTVRDISNIFFIFILLSVAVKMVLGIGSDAGKNIKNIILVALLINFSLFFTKIVIDASNIFSLYLYDASTTSEVTITDTSLSEADFLAAETKLEELLDEKDILTKQYFFIRDNLIQLDFEQERAKSDALFEKIQNPDFKEEILSTLYRPAVEKGAYITNSYTPEMKNEDGTYIWPLFVFFNNPGDEHTYNDTGFIRGTVYPRWFFDIKWIDEFHVQDEATRAQKKSDFYSEYEDFIYPGSKDAVETISDRIKVINEQLSFLNTQLTGGKQATISTSFMKNLAIQKLFLKSRHLDEVGEEGSATKYNLFLIVFLIFTFIAFFKMAMILLVRLILLMFILVFSPLAFMGILIPKLKSKVTDKWLETLTGQAVVGPVFFFFMFLILKITESVAEIVENNSFGAGNLTSTPDGISNGEIFSFILIIGLIYLAVKITKDVAGEFSAQITGMAGKIVGGVAGGAATLALGAATGGASLAARGLAAGATQTLGRAGVNTALGKNRIGKWVTANRDSSNFATRNLARFGTYAAKKAGDSSWDINKSYLGKKAFGATDALREKVASSTGAYTSGSKLSNTLQTTGQNITTGGFAKFKEGREKRLIEKVENRQVQDGEPLDIKLNTAKSEVTKAQQNVKVTMEQSQEARDLDTAKASGNTASIQTAQAAYDTRKKQEENTNQLPQKQQQVKMVEKEIKVENEKRTNDRAERGLGSFESKAGRIMNKLVNLDFQSSRTGISSAADNISSTEEAVNKIRAGAKTKDTRSVDKEDFKNLVKAISNIQNNPSNNANTSANTGANTRIQTNTTNSGAGRRPSITNPGVRPSRPPRTP